MLSHTMGRPRPPAKKICSSCHRRREMTSIRKWHGVSMCTTCVARFKNHKDCNDREQILLSQWDDALVFKLLDFLQCHGHATLSVECEDENLLVSATHYLKWSLRSVSLFEIQNKLKVLGDVYGPTSEGFSRCFLQHYMQVFEQQASGKSHGGTKAIYEHLNRLRTRIGNIHRKNRNLLSRMEEWSTAHFENLNSLQTTIYDYFVK